MEPFATGQTSPLPTGAGLAAAVRAVRLLVKMALSLLGVVAFLVLEFGTDVADAFAGTPKQVAFALVMICFTPGLVLYFPLSWAATAWVKRRIRAHPTGGAPRPGPPGRT